MGNRIERQVEFMLDQDVIKTAEAIIAQSGLSPALLIESLYTEIVKTGKLPLNEESLNQAKLVSLSTRAPSFRIETQADAKAFFEDDGGY